MLIPVLTLVTLGCSLGSLIARAPSASPTPTKTLIATFTATATSTATTTPTATPVATDTPPAPTETSTPAASPTPQYTTYVVQAGDTLSGIARKFGITVQALRDANGITSDIINIGTQLVIPSGGGSVSPPPNPTATRASAAPTATPRPQAPAPTATRPAPTATRPAYQYVYVGGMREQEKGCTGLGVEGVIQDAGGNGIAGKLTVRWQLDGYVDYFVTGDNPVELPGVFKFDIIATNRQPIYHGTKNSILQIIESEANPIPLSEPFTWQVLDCLDGPERFVNITFRHR